ILKSTYDNQNYYHKYLTLNGRDIGLLGDKKNPIYGHHEEVFKAEDIAFMYLINSYYIPSKINVKNSQIYDLGIRLEFNGQGYLNGEEIINEFIIEEVGEYSLVVHGSGGVREIINFKVDNLSLNDKTNKAYDF